MTWPTDEKLEHEKIERIRGELADGSEVGTKKFGQIRQEPPEESKRESRTSADDGG